MVQTMLAQVEITSLFEQGNRIGHPTAALVETAQGTEYEGVRRVVGR